MKQYTKIVNNVEMNFNFTKNYTLLRECLAQLGPFEDGDAADHIGGEFVGVYGKICILGNEYTIVVYNALEANLVHCSNPDLDCNGHMVEIYDKDLEPLGDGATEFELHKLKETVLKQIVSGE